MDEVTLYGIGVSAFVAKVRITLDFKGIAYRELPPPDGYGSTAYRAAVPAGTIPGLVHGQLRLSDSNAIMEYLEEAFPEPALMPADMSGRARVRMLLGFHDTRVEAGARALFPLIKTRDGDPAPAIAALEASLERLVAMREGVAAGAPSLADIAYPCTLQMAQLMAAELGARVDVPRAIAGWVEGTSAIPAVARSLSIARTAMESWMAGFRPT